MLPEGIRCIFPAELYEIREECIFFITTGRVLEAMQDLRSLGIRNVFPIYQYDLEFWMKPRWPEIAEIQSGLAQCSEVLEDTFSGQVLETVVRRIWGGMEETPCMAGVCEENQYFPADLIKLTDHECFVDAGAFDGDTLLDFLSRVKGHFERYDAFELCQSNYRRLFDRVSALQEHGRIRVFELGLADAPGEVVYGEAGMDSSIGIGEKSGRVDTLDHVLGGRKVTFIKMDIEGFELKALRGAEQTIRKWKPVLAICVYHEVSHLWEIPLYLKSLVPEYRIYLRHHTQLGYETVCYAIPAQGE